MRHLTNDIGWQTLILCAVLFVAAVPAIVAWAKYELRLSRRSSQLRPHKAREGWPYW